MTSYYQYFSRENNRVFKTKILNENNTMFRIKETNERINISWVAYTSYRSATPNMSGKKFSYVSIFINSQMIRLGTENKNVSNLYRLVEKFILNYDVENINDILDINNLSNEIRDLVINL